MKKKNAHAAAIGPAPRNSCKEGGSSRTDNNLYMEFILNFTDHMYACL